MIDVFYHMIEGDAFKELPKLKSKSVDMVFADPPYNLTIGEQPVYRPDGSEVKGVKNAEWDKIGSVNDYREFSTRWIEQAERILKDTGLLVVMGGKQSIYIIGDILLSRGWWIISDVIWWKTNAPPNFRGTRLRPDHETIIIAKKSKSAKTVFNYQTLKALNGGKQMGDVWQMPYVSRSERTGHYTQKPLDLMKPIIQGFTLPGQVILDPFMGSGTTGVSCKRYGRSFIGIELDPDYYTLAVDRIGLEDLHNDWLPHRTDLLKTLPRVSLKQLIDEGYIEPDMPVFLKDYPGRAWITEDGKLLTGADEVGSIHQIAKLLTGERLNGWEVWTYNGVLLNDIRLAYWNENCNPIWFEEVYEVSPNLDSIYQFEEV